MRFDWKTWLNKKQYNVKVILDGNVVASVPMIASGRFEAEHNVKTRVEIRAEEESSDSERSLERANQSSHGKGHGQV